MPYKLIVGSRSLYNGRYRDADLGFTCEIWAKLILERVNMTKI